VGALVLPAGVSGVGAEDEEQAQRGEGEVEGRHGQRQPPSRLEGATGRN
jgi:hypothetical protein